MVQVVDLDKEIEQYLPLLGKEEKESILGVIKSFLSLKNDSSERISIEQYNRELDEALKDVREGNVYTQEQAEKISSEW